MDNDYECGSNTKPQMYLIQDKIFGRPPSFRSSWFLNIHFVEGNAVLCCAVKMWDTPVSLDRFGVPLGIPTLWGLTATTTLASYQRILLGLRT